MAATTPALVASKFDEILKAQIGPVQYSRVIELNRTMSYAHACASHDYCDSNMVMDAAVRSFGVDPDSGAGYVLWGVSWEAWRKMTR